MTRLNELKFIREKWGVFKIYNKKTGKLVHSTTDPAKSELIIDNEHHKGWLTCEGKFHREDGPAIIRSDGSIEWYIMNKAYTFQEWCKKLNKSDEEITILKLTYITAKISTKKLLWRKIKSFF